MDIDFGVITMAIVDHPLSDVLGPVLALVLVLTGVGFAVHNWRDGGPARSRPRRSWWS